MEENGCNLDEIKALGLFSSRVVLGGFLSLLRFAKWFTSPEMTLFNPETANDRAWWPAIGGPLVLLYGSVRSLRGDDPHLYPQTWGGGHR